LSNHTQQTDPCILDGYGRQLAMTPMCRWMRMLLVAAARRGRMVTAGYGCPSVVMRRIGYMTFRLPLVIQEVLEKTLVANPHAELICALQGHL
jgi:hypothetical protein